MALQQEDSKPSTSIDPNQLLNLCFRISECTRQLESSINLSELYLATLSYVDDDTQASSLKCLDQLVELNGLSQSMVHLLDELNTKLSETAPGSIENQIACQQLAYFSGLWSSELTPRLEGIFATKRSGVKLDESTGSELSKSRTVREPTGVQEALLRLRGSVGENERLIASIAANVDSTRTTIDSIYESLQAARQGLVASRSSALKAANLLNREGIKKLVVGIVLIILVFIVLYFLYKMIFG